MDYNDTEARFFIKNFMKFDKKFKCINPYQLNSWADVMLICVANGIEENFELFKLLLCGAMISNSLYKLFVYTLSKTDFLDQLACTDEAANALFEITKQQDRDLILLEWQKFFKEYEQPKGDIDDGWIDTVAAGNNMLSKTKRYKLFSLFDLKFPLIWIKFYNKYKKKAIADSKFMFFLKYVTNLKFISSKFSSISSVLNAFLDDLDKSNNSNMHMN